MGKEKKEISRKALIGIIVALIIIVIIAFGVIIFFVRKNTTQTENTLKNNVNNNEIADINSTQTNKRTLEPTEENIREQIAFFNENEDLGLEPTQEQINEIIEYAKDLEEYNDDILMEFILQKGWTVRGTQMIDYDNLTMPNLIGMNCVDLRDYLDSNYLYFIEKINYQYTEASTKLKGTISSPTYVPTKVISTIPAAGTKLDFYENNSITIVTEAQCVITSYYINLEDENINIEDGATIKLQIGKNENCVIEGTVGEEFSIQSRSGSERLVYLPTANDYNKYSNDLIGHYLDLIRQNKIISFSEDEIIKETWRVSSAEYYSYVPGKIWVNNKFIKNLRFSRTDKTLESVQSN